MKCPHCDVEHSDENKFCCNTGKPLKGETQPDDLSRRLAELELEEREHERDMIDAQTGIEMLAKLKEMQRQDWEKCELTKIHLQRERERKPGPIQPPLEPGQVAIEIGDEELAHLERTVESLRDLGQRPCVVCHHGRIIHKTGAGDVLNLQSIKGARIEAEPKCDPSNVYVMDKDQLEANRKK